ncbi:MAG: asparaginase [Gammaproteobacteria bacterium]|nr:asparaginase [Gammaproteobacteria bacterium]
MSESGAAKLPKVAVIGTGGTISSVGRHSRDLLDYVVNNRIYHIHELLSQVPETEEVARVVPVPFRAIPSTAMGPAQWLELNQLVHDLVHDDPEIDGVVITHGTASLEETAYFLNLTLKVAVPVVVVGAQRPASGISTDANANLLNAVRVAGCPDSHGLGVVVVLNDEIHAARDVTKTSTLKLHTFRSPDFGCLGHADADKVAYYRHPLRRRAPDTQFDVRGTKELPRVDIVMSYAGADGAAIRGCVDAGAQGIVSAGFAPGLSTQAQREVFAEYPELLVVQSSRVGSGRVAAMTGLRAVKTGAIADNLTPQKARVLLMLGLTVTREPDELQRLFDEY